ncbi:type I-C CRISPR-associated endonuclease Cas1c [Tistrella sp. BH-R2-4]|uniref:CRISPR-associated endonuclease Cas1 n=1 Tax=Tistrella arctica TaxID=3133430 RepID=A0ABU9YQM2_9PROT
MKRYLNTLYVTTQDAWVVKDGANLVVRLDQSEIGRVPMHLLGAVVGIGLVGFTAPVLAACAEAGITVSMLDRNGRFQARVEGPVSGNVLLRRAQYRVADQPAQAAIYAGGALLAKLDGQRAVLRRALRDHGAAMTADAGAALAGAETLIGAALGRVQRIMAAPEADAQGVGALDRLRGIEGEAAAQYFAVFGHLLRVDDPGMRFEGRSRRPPRDPVNALLSFLYVLLTHDCRSALETAGLDPAVGFLHRDRPGRPGLALDLMEEFRPGLADRLALTLINRREIGARDFTRDAAGGFTLKDDARKRVLVAWTERKRETLTHPFLNEPAAFGLMPHLQALLLARTLRGDLDAYPPWLPK